MSYQRAPTTTSLYPSPFTSPAVLTDLQEMMQRDEPDIEAVAAKIVEKVGKATGGVLRG